MSATQPKDAKRPKKSKKQTKWIVERGSATARIYLTPHGTEKYYTVSYWTDGKRTRQVFPTLQAAKDVAAEKATQMTNGDLGAAKLTNADSAAYNRAIALLRPSGAALEFAASEYANAVKRLGAVSLSQAVDFYLKRHPVHLQPKTVREVVDELFKTKAADKLSPRYLKQLEYDLKRFTTRFEGRLDEVSGRDIDAWLRGLAVGPRTRNNLRGSIQALFNFAMGRKYLPKDHDEMDAVPVAKDDGGAIEIFTPDEMAEILAAATPQTLPFFALAAFAGIRHAEVQRLDWAQVHRNAKIIEIQAGMAKTASRRVIPLLPNLAKWLEGHWQGAGPVCTYANMADEILAVTRSVNHARRAAWAEANEVDAKALKRVDEQARKRQLEAKGKVAAKSTPPAGVETAEEEGWAAFAWKHNALRHSFISYRVAETQDVAKVSLEAGNSPQMIFKHYRELVRPAEAKAWFAIVPKGKGDH